LGFGEIGTNAPVAINLPTPELPVPDENPGQAFLLEGHQTVAAIDGAHIRSH
jgi:hypothetical protein